MGGKRKRTAAGADPEDKWVVSQKVWARGHRGTFETPRAEFQAWIRSLSDQEREEFWAVGEDRADKQALREWEESGCPAVKSGDPLKGVAEVFRRQVILRALGAPESLDVDQLREEFEIEVRDLEDWSNRRKKGFAKADRIARKLQAEISALQVMERERPENQPRSIDRLVEALGARPSPPRMSIEGKRLLQASSLLVLARALLEPTTRRPRGRLRTFVSFLEERFKAEGLTDGTIAKVLKLEGVGEVSREQIRDRRRKARRRRTK